jgi:predicted lipoprotein with Yx(FWY)xxD motif
MGEIGGITMTGDWIDDGEHDEHGEPRRRGERGRRAQALRARPPWIGWRTGPVAGLFLAMALVLAGCNSSGSGGIYGGGSTGGTSGTGGAGGSGSAGQIGTTVIGSVGTVLDDGRGFTLYHLTTETGGQIKCTGSCPQTWPPLLISSGQATASGDLSAKLGTVQRPDGSTQVTFDGMPLYTYAGDSAPGQANGQGVGGVWFAVTPSGAAGGSTSSGGRYGNGGG